METTVTKRLCLLVVACLLVVTLKSQAAVTNVHALVTFTNTVKGVTNGDTITVNGDIRRYTNGILAAPANWILSTNNVGWAATNTWLHLATYSPAGVDRIYNTNTNALVIVGTFRTNTALVVSLSSGVGTVSYSTNVWAEAYSLMAPNGSLATEAARTNNASGLIGLLNDNRQTNAVNNGVAALSNLLDRISQQTASNKLFYASTNSRGLLDYTRVTNAAGIQGSNAVLVGVNLTGVTNLTGTNVTLTNASVYTVGLYGLTTANGNVGLLTNGGWRNAGLTNGFAVSQTNVNGIFSNLINYGQAIRSEGSGGNSLQVGSNALALGDLSMAIGNGAIATNTETIAIGVNSRATNDYATAVGASSLATNVGATAIGYSASAAENSVALGRLASASQVASVSIGDQSAASGEQSIAIGGADTGATAFGGIAIGVAAASIANQAVGIGYQAQAGHSNSLALGPQDHAGNAVATTTTNQLRLGTANHTVSIPGQLLISGSQSNTTFTGTNLARGAWAYPRYDLNTLGGGNNLAVPVGTNRFVRVGSGPASAATIVGMVGGATSGGIDGQDVVLYNDTGYGLTFAVNSVDPVPANRINTPTATDITIPDQGWAQFFYDGTDARWKLINAYSGTNLVATSTNLAVSTNGTLVGNGAINFTTGITGYLSGATLNLGVSAAGGGAGLVTNANQFGADTTLTIKDGALLTNVVAYGNNTNALRISSGVITSSLPAIDISQTWSNSGVTFTGVRVNAVNSNSAATSLLLDLQVNGISTAAVNRAGQILAGFGSAAAPGLAFNGDTLIGFYRRNSSYIGVSVAGAEVIALAQGAGVGQIIQQSGGILGWSSTTDPGVGPDIILRRDAAATLQLGTDAATVTAQTIKAHDGSGTDKAGASLSINGGQSTGTGVGGALIKNTSLTGSTGSSANSYSVREYIYAGETTLTEGAATGFATIALPASKYAGVHVFVTTHADDATDFQATTDMFTVSAVAKGTNISSNVQTPTQSTIASTGTLTTAITVSSTTNNTFTINCNATSSLTQTTLKAKWQIRINSDAAATVTPL